MSWFVWPTLQNLKIFCFLYHEKVRQKLTTVFKDVFKMMNYFFYYFPLPYLKDVHIGMNALNVTP